MGRRHNGEQADGARRPRAIDVESYFFLRAKMAGERSSNRR